MTLSIDIATALGAVFVALGAGNVFWLRRMVTRFDYVVEKISSHTTELAVLNMKVAQLEMHGRDMGKFLSDQGFRIRKDIEDTR